MLSVAAFLPLLHLFPPPIPPIHLSRFQSNFWLLFRGLGTVAVSSDDRVRVIGDREISAKEDQVVHSEISVLPRVTFLFSLTQYCRLSHLHQPLFSSTLSSYLPPCDLLHFSAPHNHSQCNSYSSTYSQSVIVLFFPGYHSDQQPKQLYFPQVRLHFGISINNIPPQKNLLASSGPRQRTHQKMQHLLTVEWARARSLQLRQATTNTDQLESEELAAAIRLIAVLDEFVSRHSTTSTSQSRPNTLRISELAFVLANQKRAQQQK